MSEQEPLVDRVVASTLLEKGLRTRATIHRWHPDLHLLDRLLRETSWPLEARLGCVQVDRSRGACT